jgi:hypothetical protein
MIPTAMCLSAFFGSIYITPDGVKPRPTPIPTRWKLQLVPRDLPPLPDSFYTTTWIRYHEPRYGPWRETFRFGRDTLTTPGIATIRRSPGAPRTRPGLGPQQDPNRDIPLAVYGPLVEIDGHLVTITVGEVKSGGDRSIPALSNIAIETRKNVWYQAGGGTGSNGKALVKECLLEFIDDPRVKDEGRVTVRYSEQMTDEPKGESAEFDVRFKVMTWGHTQKFRTVAMSLPNGRDYIMYLGENGKGMISGLAGIFRPEPLSGLTAGKK